MAVSLKENTVGLIIAVGGVSGKLSQFTKICKSPRLTVMFSGIKIRVSSSMPIRPYG
jgi:hypothetical protein